MHSVLIPGVNVFSKTQTALESAAKVKLTAKQAEAVLAKIDVVEQDGQLSFEEFERAFGDMAEAEVSLEAVGRQLSSIHWQIEAERKAAAAALEAEMHAATELADMTAELVKTKAKTVELTQTILDTEEGNKEMAVGRPGGKLVGAGMERARKAAVCRIVHPTQGVGTGFLAELPSGEPFRRRVVLVTNNHVLRNPDMARDGWAEFDYEEGNEPYDVQLKPEKFFLTCAEFDYTMVACNHLDLRGTQPIPLRSDQHVEEGAAIQITQHPEGRPKQTSIQVVKEVLPPFVQYFADTNYGSSGSPVFLNMEVVALHHQRSPRDRANQGILISEILANAASQANVFQKAAKAQAQAQIKTLRAKMLAVSALGGLKAAQARAALVKDGESAVVAAAAKKAQEAADAAAAMRKQQREAQQKAAKQRAADLEKRTAALQRHREAAARAREASSASAPLVKRENPRSNSNTAKTVDSTKDKKSVKKRLSRPVVVRKGRSSSEHCEVLSFDTCDCLCTLARFCRGY
eukprot:SAG31_NODE_70_length_28117_cov_100.521843_32_plen_518_part_00